jgi:hypothetical protein
MMAVGLGHLSVVVKAPRMVAPTDCLLADLTESQLVVCWENSLAGRLACRKAVYLAGLMVAHWAVMLAERLVHRLVGCLVYWLAVLLDK